MKVGTDACILGAWAHHPAPAYVLDIGTGTGLLSLMLAQRFTNAHLDALEPEAQAARQAEENFTSSPWADRLFLHECSVQEYFPKNTYDLIVCNPPFYPNHLKTTDHRRNLALHQEILDFNALAIACARLLAKEGLCYILLPPGQATAFEKQANLQGLFVQQRLLVRERTSTPVHRTIFSYSREKAVEESVVHLTIRSETGDYSADYQALLHDFYLKFEHS